MVPPTAQPAGVQPAAEAVVLAPEVSFQITLRLSTQKVLVTVFPGASGVATADHVVFGDACVGLGLGA